MILWGDFLLDDVLGPIVLVDKEKAQETVVADTTATQVTLESQTND